MSHWRNHVSKVLEDVERPLLEKALGDMKLKLDTGIKSVKNSYGSAKVDAAITRDGKPLSIGVLFVETDGKVKLKVAGDWFATGLNESTFVDGIAHSYQKYRVEDESRMQGWVVDATTERTDGCCEVEISRWV